MRALALISLLLGAVGLIGCPADASKSRGRELPPANVNASGQPANPSLKPVTPMPDFTGKQPAAASQPAAAGQPGVVMKNPASMPGPGTVIPGVTPPAADTVIKGQVTEVHHVKEYSYVQVKTAKGDIWAAVPKMETIAVGNQVSIQRDMWMTGFQSPSLGRTFDRIAFGNMLN